MSNGECREYAAYCLEMVGLAKTESNRMNYLDLAQAWLSVAVSQSLQNEDAERPAQLAQWQSRASSTIRWTGIGGGYMVERFYCGEVPRQVTIREGTERWPLDPRFDLHKHSSSTGFAWGEGGAEPARQLALALLADALRNDARALDVHQDFNQRVVPLFPKRWTISRSRILRYVDRIEAQHKTISQEVRTYSLALAPETDRQN